MVLIIVDLPSPVWPDERVHLRVSHACQNAKENANTRTDDDHVELETTLQELVLNLRGDAVETDIRRRANLFGGGRGHGWLEGEDGVGTKDESEVNRKYGLDGDALIGVYLLCSDVFNK